MTGWNDIRSIQMQGVAALVDEKEEFDRAMGMLLNKYPQMAEMPPNPDMALMKVTFFLDFTAAFMNREPVTY